MTLSQPPIGLAAVEAFYNPVAPQLVEELVSCGTREFHITAHKKAMPNIKAFFMIVTARSLDHLVTSWDGCYVNRPKRLSNQLSMHGRGAAFDINAAENPQGDAGGTMSPALVEIARSLGFFWGGDFKGEYVDKMHFQLGVDFALNGRPEPRVTYPDTEVSGPVAAPPQITIDPFRTVKVFDVSTGALVGMASDAGLLFTDGHAYIRATALGQIFAETISASLESGVVILRAGQPEPVGTAKEVGLPKEVGTV